MDSAERDRETDVVTKRARAGRKEKEGAVDDEVKAKMAYLASCFATSQKAIEFAASSLKTAGLALEALREDLEIE
jgi:hypothetical protein